MQKEHGVQEASHTNPETPSAGKVASTTISSRFKALGGRSSSIVTNFQDRKPSGGSMIFGETMRSMKSGVASIASLSNTTSTGTLKGDISRAPVKTYRFILMPDSTFRMRWDMMILCFVVYFGINVPIRMAFEDQNGPDPVVDAIEDLGVVIFIIDMVLNFRTAIKSNGIIISDPKKIRAKYLKTWFLIDLVASIPVDSLLGDRSGVSINKVLRLLRIFKLFRVFRIARILQRIEEFTKFNPSVLRLIKLFVSMVISWHWIACCYWYIADLENFGFEDADFSTPQTGFNREGGNQWVPPAELWCSRSQVQHHKCNETAFEDFERIVGYNPFKGIDYCIEFDHCQASFILMYANSFFWAVMVTTGIGRDIMPVTGLEHAFSTIIILVGVMMYAVIIGSASSALSSLDSDSTAKRQKLESINQFMRQRAVPLNLRKKVREYYEYMWSSHQSLNGEDGMMNDLHETLRLQLHIALNRKLIQNIPIFTMISDSRCLITIIEKLKPRIFIPGEFVCLTGEIGKEMYIIVRGTVHILVGAELRYLASLTDGEVFGEQSLLTRSKRNASIRAVTYCEMLILNQTDFEEVLFEYPEFFDTLRKSTQRRRSKSAWLQFAQTLSMVRGVRMLGVKVNMRDALISDVKMSHVLEHMSEKVHADALGESKHHIGTSIRSMLKRPKHSSGFKMLNGKFSK